MSFNDWLLEEGYVSDLSLIQNELSSTELDILYEKWTNETGDY